MRDKGLTDRRREILEFIESATREHGYPPTVREIGEAVGLSSSSSVQFQLRELVKLGYLQRDGSLTRALRVRDAAPREAAGLPAADDHHAADIKWLPLVGEVAAGQPVFAEENLEDTVPLPARFAPSGEAFMLRVEGQSMIEAGIHHGDYVIVSRASTAEDGDIVVALLDDEATVKTFYRRDQGFELRPANSAMEPIFVDTLEILGKVRGILRTWS